MASRLLGCIILLTLLFSIVSIALTNFVSAQPSLKPPYQGPTQKPGPLPPPPHPPAPIPPKLPPSVVPKNPQNSKNPPSPQAFTVKLGEFVVTFHTQSTITNAKFSKEQKRLSAEVSGPLDSVGTLTVDIPRGMLDKIYQVNYDKTRMPFDIKITSDTNSITVKYMHKGKLIIFGKTVH